MLGLPTSPTYSRNVPELSGSCHAAGAGPEEANPRTKGPAKPRVERAARIVGFTALAIGLTLILAIVLSMVFGYQ